MGIFMWLAAYAIGITIVLVVICVYHYRERERQFYDYQDKVTGVQLEEMHHIYMTMRGWRHDYHNHMQKIRAHLALGEYQEADKYIDLMETELAGIDLKYHTGNAGVDAMLNSKLTLADKNGLQIKCDAILPEKLPFNQIDLCVLLGNLIDNAIEACGKMLKAENRFLRIYMCVQKQQLYISVSNATNEPVRKLDRDYISKKRGNHGHGLKRINLIVEKHQGYLNRQNEPGVFATEIMLPLDCI
ncbi:MAG: GHKL domain-containing protein [Lachnospiraceae bacterium]|nr:GHKL domain-containing protein [Lachnospiraceae bacterium]